MTFNVNSDGLNNDNEKSTNQITALIDTFLSLTFNHSFGNFDSFDHQILTAIIKAERKCLYPPLHHPAYHPRQAKTNHKRDLHFPAQHIAAHCPNHRSDSRL